MAVDAGPAVAVDAITHGLPAVGVERLVCVTAGSCRAIRPEFREFRGPQFLFAPFELVERQSLRHAPGHPRQAGASRLHKTTGGLNRLNASSIGFVHQFQITDHRCAGHLAPRSVATMASLTGRGPLASDGLFTIFPFTTIVDDPPPSRLSASVSCSRSQRRSRSLNCMPTA